MFELLHEKGIYPIPIGAYWNVDDTRIWMLYAPKKGSMQLVSNDELNSLRQELDNSAGINPMPVDDLLANRDLPVMYLPETPHELIQVDLLLNYTCNFHCVYCYSAHGRSSQQGKFEDYKAVMDYLFCSGRKQTGPYLITFSGGGEPLMSFPLIKRIVEYTEHIAEGKGYYYSFGMVSNGSLLTSEIATFLLEHNINIAISFEIIEELQNKERGNYEKVASNIDMLSDMNVPFGVRTTFTMEAVSAMNTMIETVASRFPKLKHVVFDVVLSPALFATPTELDGYYNAFLENFYHAKELAALHGILLESNAVETQTLLRDRTCEGKIVVTPSGTITNCSRVSSPSETLYGEYVYGRIKDGQVEFDENEFRRQMSEHNIYTSPECKDCFAKWNCGGGCRLFHHSFGSDFVPVRCNFVRKALKEELWHTLSARFRKQTGGDLHTFIKSCIDSGKC